LSRLDHKSGGRFTPRFETTEIDRAALGYQYTWGDYIDYYRYAPELSSAHEIYDEPAGEGRKFSGPHRIPVMSVNREEGMPDRLPGGLYWTDSLFFTVPYAGLVRAGMHDIDIAHGNYTRDRLIYDDRVFQVTRIQVHGQVNRRDMMVVITAVQLKPADLIGDEQFSAWWAGEAAVDVPHMGAGTTVPPGSNIISLTDFDNRYVRHEQLQEALEQIELTPGPPGPPGPPGEIRTIEVTFATPVSVWDVAHDLDHQPEVTTTDLYGAEIKGDVRFLPGNVVVTWHFPVAGKIRLM